MQAAIQSPAAKKSSRVDWLAFSLLCGVIGYSACWVQHRVHSTEIKAAVLGAANENWSAVYNDLQASCVPVKK